MPSGLEIHSIISNPKRHADKDAPANLRLFPYYAGYSSVFVRDALNSLHLPSAGHILDPWNGSGTTTQVSGAMGFNAVGFDLNPVMVLAAKASFLSSLEAPSLRPIADNILISLLQQPSSSYSTSDPLLTWFHPASAAKFRALEHAINKLLISSQQYVSLQSNEAVDSISPLAAFFYVVLFRSIRYVLSKFIPTNPTWIKRPQSSSEKVQISTQQLRKIFLEQLAYATKYQLFEFASELAFDPQIKLGNAELLPLPDESVDAVITSPPYCTRLDYAVATAIELAIMRFDETAFDSLRRSLTGTATVSPAAVNVCDSWGETCTNFLDQVLEHPSKASRGYYYKNHTQYFGSMSKSISEIARVLQPGSFCVLVAQDSHYKEIHNDIPRIISEMANRENMYLQRRVDFPSNRSMVLWNGRSRKYLEKRRVTESILWLQKT